LVPVPTFEAYLVGSCEKHFVVDRVYAGFELAKAYCKSRKNAKHSWIVLRLKEGEDLASGEIVFRTEADGQGLVTGMSLPAVQWWLILGACAMLLLAFFRTC
jgi:hypothetical protein